MAPLAPLLEFAVHPTRASLEAPLGRDGAALENLAARCDDANAYRIGVLVIRGKRRVLAMPERGLDVVQRRINEILYPIDQSFGSSPHGYVVQRSTLTNARPHTGARFLQKFDIRNYFSSITSERVEEVLFRLGFGPEAARLLSRLTSCGGRLPLGARTSPRISNMMLMDFDEEMERISRAEGLTYTRYADDLAFSGRSAFDVKDAVDQAITRAGFELNDKKTRSFKHGQPMFVTGLSVEDGDHPRIRKRLKSRLRQEFYFIERYGLESHADSQNEPARWTASRLLGEFHYVRAVEPMFTERLSQLYPKASAAVVPAPNNSRIERAEHHRQQLIDSVSRAPAQTLPYYVPFVALS